ncbi:hypothetical protein H0H87_002042 [Tephrocybe sp. NHM501043]|nr:hypothetical protein H0H87_002042 [Tephrocybe sp. NHM501043]
MAKSKTAPIEVPSSPEPLKFPQNSPNAKRVQRRAKSVPKAGPSKSKKNKNVIELTDSDDNDEPTTRIKPVVGPSNPRKRPEVQKLGTVTSIQNIPVETRRKTPARAQGITPLFLHSDEENNPALAQKERRRTPVAPEPFPFQAHVEPQQPAPPPSPVAPAREPSVGREDIIDVDLALLTEPAMGIEATPAADPHSMMTARVLEIIPDVEPEYLLALITQNTTAHPEHPVSTIVELILHALFEDPKYPKVDRYGKGKRKADDMDGNAEGSISDEREKKKQKTDYKDVEREFRGGLGYGDAALEYLQISFSYTPKPYLRTILGQHNGLYAPTHLFLATQEKNNARLPYSKRSTPYRPKGKGRAGEEDEELEKERKWLLEYLDGDGNKVGEEGAQEVAQESDGESHDPKIKCMDQSNCSALFPESQLRRILPKKMMDLYERVKQKKEVAEAGLEGLEECPFCEWGCVVDRSFEEEKLLKCGNVECGRVSCRGCKKDDHLPKSCKEMEEDKLLDGKHAVEEAMTQALMRNCPKCQKPFIKESGCNKMTCPNCMTLSCYVCRQVIRGYDHFNQQQPGLPTPAGGSNHPDASKCLLWDSVEQRHANEVHCVRAAAERAQQQYRQENPDVDEDALKVDIPVAPPPAANTNNPQLVIYQRQLNDAQVAFNRAVADQGRLIEQEHAHRLAMAEREKKLASIQDAARSMPERMKEYDIIAAELRQEMVFDQQEWYRLRAAVERASQFVIVERGRLDQANRIVQVDGAALAGMNHMWGAAPAPTSRFNRSCDLDISSSRPTRLETLLPSAMLQDLSNMDRITQLQDEIQQASPL